MTQARCTSCSFSWSLTLDIPKPGDPKEDVAYFKKQARSLRCPRCRREGRETSFDTIEVGETEGGN